MREYLYVDDSQKDNYLNTFFDAYWNDNLVLSIDKEIIQLLKNLNINDKKFLNGINEQ